mmetsp:Transcript_14852/g.25493  ORF Transcript_14852/g.25493 Transcript_14852/m.25493 type:complete len:271 (-) Transcript_14852:654-1466(-)
MSLPSRYRSMLSSSFWPNLDRSSDSSTTGCENEISNASLRSSCELVSPPLLLSSQLTEAVTPDSSTPKPCVLRYSESFESSTNEPPREKRFGLMVAVTSRPVSSFSVHDFLLLVGNDCARKLNVAPRLCIVSAPSSTTPKPKPGTLLAQLSTPASASTHVQSPLHAALLVCLPHSSAGDGRQNHASGVSSVGVERVSYFLKFDGEYWQRSVVLRHGKYAPASLRQMPLVSMYCAHTPAAEQYRRFSSREMLASTPQSTSLEHGNSDGIKH